MFSTATDAVTAQQSLAEAAIPFEVRMGLHTGEAKEREGNYFGTDVNRAARLMSLAHGGQVVVSDTTEVLLRQRVALRPLGERLTRRLGAKRTEELSLAGALLDLNDTALYAQRQIDLARRSPIPRQERPGGLSRREIEGPLRQWP